MSRKKKRIVHVTSGLGVGGAETMLYRLVHSLQGSDGYEHTVVTLTDTCSFDFRAIDVPVDVIDFRGIVRPVLGLVRLRQTLVKRAPDVIQAWMYHGNVAATLAGPAGVPVVWGIHHSLHDLPNEKVAIRLLIRMGMLLSKWKKTQKIVYVSGKSKAHHCVEGYAAEKSVVIPNGFDCGVFRPDEAVRISTRRELGFDDRHLLVGNFGRYHPVKNHDLLLRAFSAIAEEFPNAHMLLAGVDMLEANLDLIGLARALGIAERVVLLGPRNDMPRMYNALDLHVLSSRSESFPNVLGEASACGVPSITTDVGDAARIIGDTGRIVPSASIDAMSNALREMLSLEPSERKSLGALARQRIVDSFGLPVAVRAYADLYEGLIESEARFG